MFTVEDVKRAVQGTEYECYGIRNDEIRYSPGDIANNSHQLFQDPVFGDDDELVYPEGEGIYEGYYDAGELEGTCVIEFRPDDDSSISKALKEVWHYCGRNTHVLAGDVATCGNDSGEIIIKNAIVLAATEA